MKKEITILVILSFLIGTFNVFSISKESFRMKGLGTGLKGYVYDEYTSIFDNPAYLSFIKGHRLYTNLSNYQGLSIDKVFGQLSPTGSSISLIPSSLLGGVTNYKDDNVCVMLERGGLSGAASGSFNTIPTGTDSSGSNDYDKYYFGGGFEKTEILGMMSTRLNIDKLNKYSTSADASGWLLAYSRLNMSFKYQEENSGEDKDSSGNLTNKYIYTDEIESFGSYNGIKFKYGKLNVTGIDNRLYENGMTFKIEPELFRFGYKVLDYSIDFDYPSNIELKDIYDDDKNDYSAYALGINAGYETINSHSWRSNADLTTIMGINNSLIPGKYKHYKKYYYHYEYEFPPETRENTYEKWEEISGFADLVKFRYGKGTRWYLPNNTMLALAVTGNVLTGFYKGTMPENVTTTKYKDITNDGDSSNDIGYITTKRYGKKTSLFGFGAGVYLEIPVGIEVKFFDNRLALRVGNKTLVPVAGWGKNSLTYEKNYPVTETKYTDGPNSGQTKIVTDTTVSTSKTDMDFSGYLNTTINVYSFGASYKLNDNIDIDLLHFANLTDLSSWLLSITIKFGETELNDNKNTKPASQSSARQTESTSMTTDASEEGYEDLSEEIDQHFDKEKKDSPKSKKKKISEREQLEKAYCPYCEAPVKPGAKFCTHCGKKLD